MRFSYYARLSPEQKATYRKSDAITRIDVPDASALAPFVTALEGALRAGVRRDVGVIAGVLSDALLDQLGAPRVRVLVRAVRPHIEDGELHGLYTFAQKGRAPKLEVWMKTAAHARVVSFRTFLRTLLHELVHHLDVTLFALDDSFHTEGFFRRESSLVRQLLPPREPPEKKSPPKRSPKQIPLF